MRRITAAVVLCVAIVLTACAPWAESQPQAKVVARALRLREDRSKDASAYAELFADRGVARQLAAAAEQTSGVVPIPAHDAPYVSRLTTSSADVVVRWDVPAGSNDFPAATVFKLRLDGRSWRITDALPVETSATPAPMRQP